MVEGRPVAAQDGEAAVPGQGFVADARDVHPGRVGPGVALDVGDGRRRAARGWEMGWP